MTGYGGKCVDVAAANSANGTAVQLYACNGTAAQQWIAADDGTIRALGKCLDVTSGSTADGAKVQIWDCNGTGAQRWVANAGHVEADWFSGNATQNFWRSAENLSVTPATGTDRWAVSQAAPYRRMHVRGNLQLDDGGWSSGAFIADSKIDGQVRSGSQQQWLSRNAQWGSWTGSNWNMVFVETTNAPANSFPNPPYTTVAQTPVVREKPFLYIDAASNYNVFVPALRTNSQATTWASGAQAGSTLPISQFYIVKAGATAASINAALAAGKDLLFTPGVYHLNDTIRVTRANTVVLGLGLATVVPDNGATAMTDVDVDGVKVAGILFDAGTVNSAVLMEVGPGGSTTDHSANPTSLHDVFFRVGGAGVGKATVSLRVNSNNVIGDHKWIWRADHGSGVGWTSNTAANGLIVNGNNVTMYGLFVEHYQQYQTIWNGNGGRTYFYQNEIPYDVPNQASWMNGGTQGYAAYKVGASVTLWYHHERNTLASPRRTGWGQSRLRMVCRVAISAVCAFSIVTASAFASALEPLACSSWALLIAPLWWAVIVRANIRSKSMSVAAFSCVSSASDIMPGIPVASDMPDMLCPPGWAVGMPQPVSQPVRVEISGA
ncbi:MAG: hypothetical protein QOE61_2700 [Micromonosporaceae bacterium]|nr:hypothetical protein [Micromonosporaceae bacterium]